MKVAIIDYGMGNLYSVRNAFAALGVKADIIRDSCNLFVYDKLILPGVGAFGDAMKELNRLGFVGPIKEFVASGRPFLGICLGMHLLFEKSQESIGMRGLALVKGEVVKFRSNLKCPHIGWNKIEKPKRPVKLYSGINKDIFVYFCHSYYSCPEKKEVTIGVTDYGVKFASIINFENIYGMQFHPEKSQDIGLKLLENFIRIC